ncbi:MAG: exodeoxyribonuclease VII small subunit [Solobacterium sp.]|jgi:exodeoxyribonuclease VII small subunit|nr:exodeoxyribonuclease VII small subunit [Solobacterium sp.]MBR2669378.1 exodeoxyribonuclease VII small subunit [Solobacterium sp.]
MPEKEVSFEQSINRLEEIVSILEENDQSLDKTIALFEEGLDLVKYCDNKLKQFELKIEEIKRKNDEEE